MPVVSRNVEKMLAYVNNYRAISISTAMSKLFETAIFESVNNAMVSDDYQFGFRSSHSTAICTSVFKQVVDYYTVVMFLHVL